MSKTPKKKRKAVAAALKAMENMVFETADLDVKLKLVNETLDAIGAKLDIGAIALAGRNSSGEGHVQINIGSSGYNSIWPEWAYGVAESALHFNKKVFVLYNDQPLGSNLLEVLCWAG